MERFPVLKLLWAKLVALFAWLTGRSQAPGKPMVLPALRRHFPPTRPTWRGSRRGGRSRTRFIRADRERRNARRRRKLAIERRLTVMAAKAKPDIAFAPA